MNKKERVTILIAIGVLLLCACSKMTSTGGVQSSLENWLPGNHTLSIEVGGLERHFVVHVPQVYSRNKHWPVVIIFHGGGGTARGAMWETGFADRADREGFLAVFPEGSPPDSSRPGSFFNNPQTWNDGSERGIGAVERKIDDVTFVSAMIRDLKKRFSVDDRRIYATGFSNGASMSFRIARELSNSIAAVAPVAGTDWLDAKRSDRAVPLLYITGTADPLNPYNGGEIFIGARSYGTKPSIQDMITKWIKFYNCQEKPHIVYNKDGAKGVAYTCTKGADTVLLYTIDGHGHHWPGGNSALPERMAGKNIAHLNATEVIWDFFKAHPLSN
ncbi:MAG: dienelactone hydrolase family protein [Pseudomonadota bacterium]